MYLICKCSALRNNVYKSDANWMDVLQLLCFIVHKWIKGALSLCLAWWMILYCQYCVWNNANGLVNWKPWVSILLSQNQFTMWTHTSFLAHAFGLSSNVPLMLLISTPLHYMYEAHSASWIIICMWLHNTHLLCKVEALFNSSQAWLVEIDIIAIIDTDAYVWNIANGWTLHRNKRWLVCVSLMVSHLICGHTKCYLTVSQLQHSQTFTYCSFIVATQCVNDSDVQYNIHITSNYRQFRIHVCSHLLASGNSVRAKINPRCRLNTMSFIDPY